MRLRIAPLITNWIAGVTGVSPGLRCRRGGGAGTRNSGDGHSPDSCIHPSTPASRHSLRDVARLFVFNCSANNMAVRICHRILPCPLLTACVISPKIGNYHRVCAYLSGLFLQILSGFASRLEIGDNNKRSSWTSVQNFNFRWQFFRVGRSAIVSICNIGGAPDYKASRNG